MQYFSIKRIWFVVLALFLFLHNDFWWWQDSTVWFGLPVALTYHIIYCCAGVVLLFLLIRFNWPQNGEDTTMAEEQS